MVVNVVVHVNFCSHCGDDRAGSDDGIGYDGSGCDGGDSDHESSDSGVGDRGDKDIDVGSDGHDDCEGNIGDG